MKALFGFGFSQEDDRSEAAILRPAPGRRIVCVASGGEVPLGLAARGATVEAVDVDSAQLHLTALKHAAALAVEPADAARFLGYAALAPERRAALYPSVAPRLAAEARAFWDAHPDAIASGALWAGRFEGYLRRLMIGLRPLWGASHLDALCAATTPDEQAAVFDAHIGRPWLQSVFHLAFHPSLYGRRGIDPRALSQRQSATPLGEQYYSWLRAFCVATPAADNWFLQVIMGGGLRDPEKGPDFLRPDGVAALRAAPERLRLHHADVSAWLEVAPPLDGFHLSNLGDWMEPDAFATLLRHVAAHATPGATLLWRELQVQRSVPAELDTLRIDRPAGAALRAQDRFPFYTLVPGVVQG